MKFIVNVLFALLGAGLGLYSGVWFPGIRPTDSVILASFGFIIGWSIGVEVEDYLRVFSTILGVCTGLLSSMFFPNIIPEGYAILATVGGILGLLFSFLIDGYINLFFTRSQALSRPKDRLPDVDVPHDSDLDVIEPEDRPSIRQRLAHYFHCDEQQVMTDSKPFQSKMPFWSALDFIRQAPPKSALLIRLTLLRIRRIIRGQRGH
ncbi:MAG: hypothetical protein COA78_24065 [Blastopirellula sp.]|nr:MAG: hypothetical protein COA78_24065 [Blastopirellula sp.]